MDEPKAVSRSVSLLPELWERVEAKAAADWGGNRSAYIRSLAERDLEESPPLLGGDPLLHLVRLIRPDKFEAAEFVISRAKERDGKFNEKDFLGELLRASVAFLDEFEPDQFRDGVALVANVDLGLLGNVIVRDRAGFSQAALDFIKRYRSQSSMLRFISETPGFFDDDAQPGTTAKVDPPRPSTPGSLTELPGSGKPPAREDNSNHLRGKGTKNSKQA